MGSDGSNGPKPWTQRQARTTFLRVPYADWLKVKRGMKGEFRSSPGAVSGLKFKNPPTPVVGYSHSKSYGYDSKLLVLEARWQEPLAAISDESLAAEGFDSFADFRSYWCEREKRRFTPTRMVVAYKVRLFQDEDRNFFADQLLQHLYGEFLP